MTKVQAEKIRQEAEDLFLGDDVNLDLSQFPWLSKPLPDESFDDEKFSQIANDRPKSLRNAITRLVNENSTDTEIAGTLRAAGVEDEQRTRQFNTPGWSGEMRFERGAWHFRLESEDGEQKQFKITVADCETAQSQAAKYLDRGRVKIRALTKDESLYVARLAGQGKLADAIQNYISYAIPDYDGTNDVSADMRYQSVCDAAAWYVFLHGTPQYEDSAEAREFINSYAGGRPLTIELLRFGFAAWNEQHKAGRGLLFNQQETESPEALAENLEDLEDSQIDQLFHDVTRESLRSKIRR